ncbi:MAG: restriction endonuclease subunit S [Anaerolineaceae bacterium]|nr:restriction endonuclease subunit S [Anaerolineaceae bacterium]
MAQDMIAMRVNRNLVHPHYLLAVLRSEYFQNQVSAFTVSTTIPHLRKTDFDRLVIPIPPLHEQVFIGKMYVDFSQKIEANRRMNAMLEATARTLFKSWFVDFDPVHAKARGEQPAGMDDVTAALFPDHFEDSELGPIPAGWGIGTLGDISDFNVWTLSKRDRLDQIEYIEISEVMKGEIGIIKTYIRGEEPSRARRRLRHGDTVLSTVRPDRGAYFLCLNPSPFLIASTGFAVFTPQNDSWSFLHAALIRPEIFERLGALADGAAYPAVAPEIIAALPIVIPSAELMEAFHIISAPLYEHAEENRIESRTLAETRDALLPRLVSGELRVG